MSHELYMQRCFDLARLGAGSVSPNPMVGAVLVHDGRIIGEGWHRKYGAAHAEVNAVSSVRKEDMRLLKEATLYVSLEPCCIHGKTPPCTDLILHHKIPKVVISNLDFTPEVNGKGVEILRKAGVEVITGILEEKGKQISIIRNTFVSKNRPFIQLKFARSKDGFMGIPGRQVWINNTYSKRLTHRGRAEFDAILVGTNTAITDNPQLTNRLWFGKSPVRVLLDRTLRTPLTHFLFDKTVHTIAVTEQEQVLNADNLTYLKLDFDENLLPNLMAALQKLKITSLIVEGGAVTLQAFIEAGFWDEAHVFTGKKSLLGGIKAPVIPGAVTAEFKIGDDLLTIYRNPLESS